MPEQLPAAEPSRRDVEDWPAYYEVTAERPPWTTTITAAEAFGAHPAAGPRLAVDLGCGAGRDTRELLRRGWRVLATDMTPEGPAMLRRLTPVADRGRLRTEVSDLSGFAIPPCDLVNANLVLPFLQPLDYSTVWARIRAALPAGGRVSAMVFGDRDESASDPDMTCPSPEAIRAELDGFDIEYWTDTEEDGTTALGRPHHFHLVELVAVRPPFPGRAGLG
jgi:SAM-dependent methyltransferase